MGSTGNVQQVQQPQQQQQQHLQTQQNMVQNQQRLDFNSFDEQSYFIQPTYNFGPSQMSNFGFGGAGGPSGGGANGEGMGADFGPSDTTGGWGGPMDRMDSLTYDQQVELMDCLEGDVGTIDDYLGLVPNMTTGYYAPTNIQ